MAVVLPTRLLRYVASSGDFYVFDPYAPDAPKVHSFDIISYTWGDPVPEYDCGIRNVTWVMTISDTKLEDIKRLMKRDGIEFLWADCVCINQVDNDEKLLEVPRMYEYYKSARKCHILLDVDDVWDPQEIVDNLKFVDHILSYMDGTALASETRLSENLIKDLSEWANTKPWAFDMEKPAVRSAAIDLGVLNCYSTCISRVRSLFDNLYFSRVWTFQEMLLGKNITLWGINRRDISCIGALDVWMDLATDSRDKAYKLQAWIDSCRVLNTTSVNTILAIIEDDKDILNVLQMLVAGISSARTDIINGGPSWWHRNYKGVSNVFSAVSIRPRKCKDRADVFKGLLGIFSGLFTTEELKRDMATNDINAISFAFFKQLSIKTGYAWTKLAISSGERGEWDWIPVVPNYDQVLTTDCFSGVVNLGVLRQNGLAKAVATTGIDGTPRQYMKILLTPVENRGFQFYFKGCNCGKNVKTGMFSSEQIPTHDQCRDVVGDETGGILVQCATILGSVMDPGNDVVKYRKNLLDKLQPYWTYTDPNAKPRDWIERCVSGTNWENPNPLYLRRHNMSMNYRMIDMTHCGSRLENDSTTNISCEVRVNCGCIIIAPFSLVFEAITAVTGSPLGAQTATLDKDNRITLRDGLGLVQVGDVGRAFKLVAFGGNIHAHEFHASLCRKTRKDRPVLPTPKLQWPVSRALVREEFSHGATDMMRDYGYVETGDPENYHDGENESCGNLLICRNHPMGRYKIVGVCVDGAGGFIGNKKGRHTITIQ